MSEAIIFEIPNYVDPYFKFNQDDCIMHAKYKYNSSSKNMHNLFVGEATVPVADCNKEEFQSHPKHSMLFKDFMNYWKERNDKNLQGAYTLIVNMIFCHAVTVILTYINQALFNLAFKQPCTQALTFPLPLLWASKGKSLGTRLAFK